MVYSMITFEKDFKILRIAGGQFSRQKPRERTLSKIRQKILNMSLHHIEPGSEATKKFDNFDVFWDTLLGIAGVWGLGEGVFFELSFFNFSIQAINSEATYAQTRVSQNASKLSNFLAASDPGSI